MAPEAPAAEAQRAGSAGGGARERAARLPRVAGAAPHLRVAHAVHVVRHDRDGHSWQPAAQARQEGFRQIGHRVGHPVPQHHEDPLHRPVARHLRQRCLLAPHARQRLHPHARQHAGGGVELVPRVGPCHVTGGEEHSEAELRAGGHEREQPRVGTERPGRRHDLVHEEHRRRVAPHPRLGFGGRGDRVEGGFFREALGLGGRPRRLGPRGLASPGSSRSAPRAVPRPPMRARPRGVTGSAPASADWASAPSAPSADSRSTASPSAPTGCMPPSSAARVVT